MKRLALLLFCFTFYRFGICAQSYRNESNSERIRTATVYPNGDWSKIPVIVLNGNNSIEFSFDELSHDYRRFSYRIVHCNANWTRSELSEMDYLDGFPENEINTYEQSTNTFTNYTHYSFSIPNENVRLKVSGNYAVEIFDRDDDSKALLTLCFSLYEPLALIEGAVSATTDIDYKGLHQQMSLQIKPTGLDIRMPLEEVKLVVQQNRRRETEVRDIKPSYLEPGKLVYEHIPGLIFKAGNEYRRFEIATYKYVGLNVDRILYADPYYNALLMPSLPRTGGYVYDEDQNGRFLIHAREAENQAIEADYFLVHFSVPSPYPFEGELYLNGDLVYNKMDENSRLVYNEERKAYEKSLLLKQGSYNYQYLFKPSQGPKPNTMKLEGCYWQTRNDYQVFVYYRPLNGRYDRLIGFTQLESAF